MPSVAYITDVNTWGLRVATIVAWIMAGIVGVVILVALGWFLHRLCIRLEDAGYLYYRKSGTGGGSTAVLHELDRLLRPSIEHVVKAEDSVIQQDDEIGGE